MTGIGTKLISYFDKTGKPKWFSNDGGEWFFEYEGGQPAAFTQKQNDQLWFFSPNGQPLGWKQPGRNWIFEAQTGTPILFTND